MVQTRGRGGRGVVTTGRVYWHRNPRLIVYRTKGSLSFRKVTRVRGVTQEARYRGGRSCTSRSVRPDPEPVEETDTTERPDTSRGPGLRGEGPSNRTSEWERVPRDLPTRLPLQSLEATVDDTTDSRVTHGTQTATEKLRVTPKPRPTVTPVPRKAEEGERTFLVTGVRTGNECPSAPRVLTLSFKVSRLRWSCLVPRSRATPTPRISPD